MIKAWVLALWGIAIYCFHLFFANNTVFVCTWRRQNVIFRLTYLGLFKADRVVGNWNIVNKRLICSWIFSIFIKLGGTNTTKSFSVTSRQITFFNYLRYGPSETFRFKLGLHLFLQIQHVIAFGIVKTWKQIQVTVNTL